MLAFYNFLDCVLRWLESFSAHCGYCILGHPFHLSFHSPCCWRSLSTALLQNTFRSLTACHSMTSLPSFLPSHSTVRATRSRTDVSLPTCAGFEKQFRRQETGREKEERHRDKDTHRETERHGDLETGGRTSWECYFPRMCGQEARKALMMEPLQGSDWLPQIVC